MKNAVTNETPVRVGIFSAVDAADRAVLDLLAAGFTKDQITVVTSDDILKKHFKPFEHQDPAGTLTPQAAATGGAIGALIGLTAAATVAGTGGLALFIAGPMALAAAGTGGVAGGLVGAMMTRGVEKEMANFYDQEVSKGKILVGVEDHSEQQLERLLLANQILAKSGAEPLRLAEG